MKNQPNTGILATSRLPTTTVLAGQTAVDHDIQIGLVADHVDAGRLPHEALPVFDGDPPAQKRRHRVMERPGHHHGSPPIAKSPVDEKRRGNDDEGETPKTMAKKKWHR